MKTAVDWLYALSKERELDIFDLEQAKEMEKNQIVDAVNNSGGYVDEVFWEEQYTFTKGEQYYKKTYLD
jgi:hypothetical protein